MNTSLKSEFTDSRFRVRYAETDQMGFAYYANYLVWFEVGRGSFCHCQGFSYQDMENKYQTFLPVIEASCRYKRPLRYDQEALIRTRITKFNRRSVSFEYQITSLDQGELYAEGMTRHVFADNQGKPRSLPDDLRKFFE